MALPSDPFDLDFYLEHGKIKDYPVKQAESRDYFQDKIVIKQRQSAELEESELFTFVCANASCKPRPDAYSMCPLFETRMTYSELCRHHSSKHSNSPNFFRIASFWTTCSDGHAYDTEYRLISLDAEGKDLKPLKDIYADNQGASKPAAQLCGYCHTRQGKLQRCGGCKILSYCDQECQRKHWRLIHKQDCKAWKRKYQQRTLTQQELDTLEKKSLISLLAGGKRDKLREMMHTSFSSHVMKLVIGNR